MSVQLGEPRYKTHNIPCKFLSYMQAGLPVLASINPGNDLAELIQSEGVGRVCTDHSAETLQHLAVEIADETVGTMHVAIPEALFVWIAVAGFVDHLARYFGDCEGRRALRGFWRLRRVFG